MTLSFLKAVTHLSFVVRQPNLLFVKIFCLFLDFYRRTDALLHDDSLSVLQAPCSAALEGFLDTEIKNLHRMHQELIKIKNIWTDTEI